MQRLGNRSRLYKQMDKVIEHLIAGCRRRDRNAQLGLYERYARALYATCLRIVVDPREAEEAMQDAFLKIFTHIEEYSGEASDAFEAWMRQIAVRTAIDHVRREEPEWEELPANWAIADEEEPDEDAVHYSVECVKRAMGMLPAGYRVVLSLYLFEGYDLEEIAVILRLRPASVRSQYLRAKRKLIDIVNKEG